MKYEKNKLALVDVLLKYVESQVSEKYKKSEFNRIRKTLRKGIYNIMSESETAIEEQKKKAIELCSTLLKEHKL